MNQPANPATSPKTNKPNLRLRINSSTRLGFRSARLAAWLGIVTLLWSAIPARPGQLPAIMISSIRLIPSEQIVRTNRVVFEVAFFEAVTGAQTNSFPMTPVNGGNTGALVSSVTGEPAVYPLTADIF